MKVLQRVKSETVRSEHVVAWCPNCQGGATIRHTEEETVVASFPENAALVGTGCRHCGNSLILHTFKSSRVIPGHVEIQCDCGRTLCCEGFTTTCECGADYNWNGTRLAPRRHWGEETGEQF